MTIFYRGDGVRITHRVFEVWRPVFRSFALWDLTGVRSVERAVDPPALVSSVRHGSTGIAGATAVVAAIGWTEGWQAAESPVVAVALLSLLAVSVAVSGACWRITAVEQELVAAYRGAPVSLYRSTDTRAFGQVRRALIRALEQLDDAR